MQLVSDSDHFAMRSNGAARYSRVASALHWVIGTLILVQMALGWWMQTVPKRPPGVRASWFNLHKSIGITLALLVIVRIGWRLLHAPPPLPLRVARWQRVAAMFNHRALYACMLIMPMSGYLGSSFTRYPIRYFGIVLPHWGWDWPAAKSLMSAVHDATAWALAALLAMHVCAALWHAWQGDTIFMRMWPRR
jgi:cytochrome b561